MNSTVWRISKNPLLLLVVSAGITAFLAPFVTGNWQNHQQVLRDRSDLAELMGRSSADIISAAQVREFHPDVERDKPYVLAFRTWDEQSQVVSARIASLDVPHRSAIRNAWRVYSRAMLCYYDMPGRPGTTRRDLRAGTLDALGAYLDDRSYSGLRPIHPTDAREDFPYQRAWRRLKFDLIKQRDAIVSGVLRGSDVSTGLDAEAQLTKYC